MAASTPPGMVCVNKEYDCAKQASAELPCARARLHCAPLVTLNLCHVELRRTTFLVCLPPLLAWSPRTFATISAASCSTPETSCQ